MPSLSEQDQAKILALEAMAAAGEKMRVGEIVRIYWPAPDGVKTYCFTQLDAIPGFQSPSLSEIDDINVRLIPARNAPFLTLPRTSSISDDSVHLNFSDIDGEMSRLCYTYGQGLRVKIFAYYPQVDLLLEVWLGTLRSPKEADGRTLKVSVTSGWRSPNLLLPHRLPATSCQFIWGGHLATQAEIDAHKGCPHNVHIGGDIGILNDPATGLPWTDCARDNSDTCFAHLATKRYWPGFDTVVDIIRNNQTKGPNLLAGARGNEGELSDPTRVIYGVRYIKALRLLAFRPENNTNHPDKGFIAAQFEIAEGPMLAITEFIMMGIYVAPEHRNFRYGEPGQPPTAFSPNFNTYSWTAVGFGRIQGDYRNANASWLTASCKGWGLRDVRIYTEEETFTEEFTTAPVDCILDMLTQKRFGYGEDVSRYSIPSVVETRAWHAENVSFTDPNGNHFNGPRSTFNVELNARATQQQIYDACVAARISPPFEHNGKKHFVPLRKEAIDDSIPLFTDFGEEANIVCDNNGLALVSWSYVGDDELINQYVVSFDDTANGGAPVTLTFGDQRQQLKAGRAWNDTSIRIISKNVPAFGITNMAEAARFGNLLLYLGPLDSGGIKNNFKVVFTTWFSETFNVLNYKLVRLRIRALERLREQVPDKFNFEYFRVMKTERKGDLKVEITVQAYPVEFYEQMESLIEPPPIPATGVTVNPGGGRGARPRPIDIQEITFTTDQIVLRLASAQVL